MWFPLGPLCLLWEIWTGEAGMCQMVSVSVDEGLSCKHCKNAFFIAAEEHTRSPELPTLYPGCVSGRVEVVPGRRKTVFMLPFQYTWKVSTSTHIFALCFSVLPDLPLKPSQVSELLFLHTWSLSSFLLATMTIPLSLKEPFHSSGISGWEIFSWIHLTQAFHALQSLWFSWFLSSFTD